MHKLKPCPFCGGAARVRAASFGDGGFVAGCVHTCAADPEMCAVMPHTLPSATKAGAAKDWNTRSGAEPILTYWQGEPDADIAEDLSRISGELWSLSHRAKNDDLYGFLCDASSIIGRIAGQPKKPQPRRNRSP